jgi:glycosyltransferase involved in cell wall biosynthesis
VHFATSGFFPVRAFYLHALLPRVLHKARPGICHYTNFLAPVADDRPYVVTIHDMGLETLTASHPWTKRIYTKRLTRRVARNARLVLTNSEYSKWEIIRHLGIPEHRIRVTPLAASPEFMPLPVREPNSPYFLYVGNLEPRKNIARLLEAFARMPLKSHDLLIAGNAWYRAGEIREKARTLGLNGRVKFLGYVPRADLPGLFSGATAFVYPSLLEGFGLPVLEAMACGTPVITSNNSSLKEVAGDAALLVDPLDTRALTEALSLVAEDSVMRESLSRKGVQRAAHFSWESTARLTLDAYSEASDAGTVYHAPLSSNRGDPKPRLHQAIQRTLDYAALFQYPLTPDELHDRLFDVAVARDTLDAELRAIQYKPDAGLLAIRSTREAISDAAIRDAQPHLRALASLPFIRMVAFSGATAHRNMPSAEDLDLFIIVEDGKLWACFLIAILWARLKGLRKHLCMNYLISSEVLPLFESDAFTAQQMASLKPIFGKDVYDAFIDANPFVRRHFPNFDPSRHREMHGEIAAKIGKGLCEGILRLGPIQILERVSRFALSRYLGRKAVAASKHGECEVLLERRRLKLHLNSHKNSVLKGT